MMDPQNAGGHPPVPDPDEFESGDEIDSAAIVETADGWSPPADPEAEPASDEADDGTPGGDAR